MHNLHLFFIASMLLNLTPGNDMLYVVSRSLSQGTRAGIFSAVGIFAGCFVHIFATVFGLSVIIAQSAFMFELIKFLGAGYLIYLGVKALITKPAVKKIVALPKVSRAKLFSQGMIINALNPKVALFFLSFLPQFIDIGTEFPRTRLFTLGLWFNIQGTLVLIVIAYLVARSAGFIKRNQKFWKNQEKLAGLVLIALGIKLAFFTKNEV